MSITTFAELQTAVAGYLDRTDLTANILDGIALCEAKMSADIDGRSMETRVALTCTPASAYVTLPTDIAEVRRLLLSSTTPQRALKYVTPDNLSKDYPFGSTGEPYVYTINGGQIQLAYIPDSAYSLELTYYQKIPALSSGSPTNWLLTAYPNTYLFGTLAEMAVFTMDWDHLPIYKKLYKEAVDVVNKIDWYTGSTMIVRAS